MTWQIAGIGLGIGAIIGIVLAWRYSIISRAEKNVEAESTAEALKQATEDLNEQSKIRDKYNRLRDSAPVDWDGLRSQPPDKTVTKN